MKIYIQSKSGDFNATIELTEIDTTRGPRPLAWILSDLRENGGYYAKYRKELVFVPFEEIQYIKEAGEDDIV